MSKTQIIIPLKSLIGIIPQPLTGFSSILVADVLNWSAAYCIRCKPLSLQEEFCYRLPGASGPVQGVLLRDSAECEVEKFCVSKP